MIGYFNKHSLPGKCQILNYNLVHKHAIFQKSPKRPISIKWPIYKLLLLQLAITNSDMKTRLGYLSIVQEFTQWCTVAILELIGMFFLDLRATLFGS